MCGNEKAQDLESEDLHLRLTCFSHLPVVLLWNKIPNSSEPLLLGKVFLGVRIKIKIK